MVKVHEPAVVVGDVHGQYYDLITLLDVNKSPAETNFLFLGDYVDRGIYGIEILLLLVSIKVNKFIFIYIIA
jgi:serine/threonine-protein phosphatase 2B catalytic subunit